MNGGPQTFEMTDSSGENLHNQPWTRLWPFVVITAAAVAVGIYGRFVGLGLWPFGVDEFYISRSIDNILRTGLPEFICGGYYTRGSLFQYIVASLRLIGLQPEFASRVVTAASSLVVLPAVYLLGKRLRGPGVGLLLVCILGFSVWEIEMARFARMYAPFQAAFAWYLVYFLRYTVDDEPQALIPMIALSVLGVLLWEGGALMGVTNLLPPLLRHQQGRLRRGSWRYLIGMGVFLCLLYAATRDFRGFADLPADISADSVGQGPKMLLATVLQHPGWLVLYLLPLLISAAALPWIWKLRERWIAACGLLAALLSAIAHQFLVCAAVIAVLLLASLVDWREFVSRNSRYFLWAIATSGIFWIAFGALTDTWYAGTPLALASLPARSIELARQFIGFPDVMEKIARPWGRSIPWLTLSLALAAAYVTFQVIFKERRPLTTERVLLVVALVLMLAVGAAPMDRLESRYTFFLYPLACILLIAALAFLTDELRIRNGKAILAIWSAALAIFVAAEDFQPWHVLRIDSAQVNFRLNMPPFRSNHYYPRNDVRSAGDWLRSHVQANELVVSSVPSLDPYYPDIDYFFIEAGDPRYEAYACDNGKRERWTNHSLLYSYDALTSAIGKGRRTYIVIYPGQAKKLLGYYSSIGWNPRHAWSSIEGGVYVASLQKQ